MQQVIRSGKFSITENRAFAKVIKACADMKRSGQEGTWILDEMQEAFTHLHHIGVAHSIEVWQEEKLAGGLYGVRVNNVFCGESMFSNVSNASKTALIWLCQHKNYSLIDCQVHTDHLESMGAEFISREAYMTILRGH